MANQDQVLLLTHRGVVAWNHWRQDHPESEIDLSGADLSNLNLSTINFREANLSEVDLSGSILDAADFTGAIITGCLGYPQVTPDLLLDDPILMAAFREGEIGITEIGTLDTPS
jgi:hypothetical protein